MQVRKVQWAGAHLAMATTTTWFFSQHHFMETSIGGGVTGQ